MSGWVRAARGVAALAGRALASAALATGLWGASGCTCDFDRALDDDGAGVVLPEPVERVAHAYCELLVDECECYSSYPTKDACLDGVSELFAQRLAWGYTLHPECLDELFVGDQFQRTCWWSPEPPPGARGGDEDWWPWCPVLRGRRKLGEFCPVDLRLAQLVDPCEPGSVCNVSRGVCDRLEDAYSGGTDYRPKPGLGEPCGYGGLMACALPYHCSAIEQRCVERKTEVGAPCDSPRGCAFKPELMYCAGLEQLGDVGECKLVPSRELGAPCDPEVRFGQHTICGPNAYCHPIERRCTTPYPNICGWVRTPPAIVP